MKWFILFVLYLAKVQADTCSYEDCPDWKADMLNVHLICHTHDDVGWLKTVDQYFWGANQSITKDGVQYILDSVTNELQNDPNKRFSYAESGYFSRWLRTKHDYDRHRIVGLVKKGQLEIIGGGWSQNDEATTHYLATIDQMTTGHEFLTTVFGRCGIPKVAWQIDPFGHSRETASLFAQMGLESLFFARLHYADADKRRNEKRMEFNWRGSDDLGNASDIMTHAFFAGYGPPPGFCYDEGCNDQPIMDDDQLEEYNVNERVDEFLNYVNTQAKSYQTNHILLTMGSDFQYRNARRWFANLDKLITYVNQRQGSGSKVHVLYSTPACYTKAVKEAAINLQTKTDDFFPYADKTHSYWTGYFTSRPALKGAVRQANGILQTCQAMDAIADLGPYDEGDVGVLKQAMGVLQHHDAVSGTAKQHVTNDYQKMLYNGVMECERVFNDALYKLAPLPPIQDPTPYFSFCLNLNSSRCEITQSQDQFLVTMFNAMSEPLNTFLRLPVGGASYTVSDPSGLEITPQVAPTFFVASLGPQEAQQGPNDLTFPVTVPAMGYSTYYVSRNTPDKASNQNEHASKLEPEIPNSNDDYMLMNSDIIAQFDPATGLLQSITDRQTAQTLPVSQNFFWYKGAVKSADGDQATGAYIFRPNGTTPNQVVNGPVKVQKIMGEWVQEMRQTFGSWLTQTIRLYQNKKYLEFEWTVGPIPGDDKISKEIITRFDTNIANDKVFWTDSNGRQMMKRIRNYQSTYDYQDNEPVSGNYYPVNTRIAIQDANTQLTILTDRSQGGSSIKDGSIELMLHRRCFEDDGYGVGEPLNEPGTDGRGLVIRGKHWLLFSPPSVAARLHRHFSMEMFYQPIATFAPFAAPFDEYWTRYKTYATALRRPPPANVHFLTVSQWQGASLLIRLEHLYQNGEDAELSKPVTINLKNHLTGFDISSLQEVSLTATTPINNATTPDFDITLQPMQIRTFRASVRNLMDLNKKPRKIPARIDKAKAKVKRNRGL